MNKIRDVLNDGKHYWIKLRKDDLEGERMALSIDLIIPKRCGQEHLLELRKVLQIPLGKEQEKKEKGAKG